MLLRDLQTAFATALAGDEMEELMPRIVSNGIDREQRLAVYRNNVRHNLRESLRAVYPVVERLVDTPFFDYAAERYIERCPSTSGDIHCYGASFAEFLAEFEPAAQLAYLPDTARLEWMMHEVFHAKDHAPLALDGLARLPQSTHAALTLLLHPACRLLSSPFPVHRIWEWNQPDAAQEEDLRIDGEGVSLLVRRNGYTVELMPLDAAEYIMLKALAESRTLASAYDLAVEADSNFGLAQFILRHVSLQTLVDFRIMPVEGEQERQ